MVPHPYVSLSQEKRCTVGVRLRQWYHTHVCHCHKSRELRAGCRVGGILKLVITNKYWTVWLCSTHTPFSYSHYLSATLVYPTYLPTNMTKPTILKFSSIQKSRLPVKILTLHTGGNGGKYTVLWWPVDHIGLYMIKIKTDNNQQQNLILGHFTVADCGLVGRSIFGREG